MPTWQTIARETNAQARQKQKNTEKKTKSLGNIELTVAGKRQVEGCDENRTRKIVNDREFVFFVAGKFLIEASVHGAICAPCMTSHRDKLQYVLCIPTPHHGPRSPIDRTYKAPLGRSWVQLFTYKDHQNGSVVPWFLLCISVRWRAALPLTFSRISIFAQNWDGGEKHHRRSIPPSIPRLNNEWNCCPTVR